ncbi:MAG TPA: hypothetical protein VMV81_09780 [Phycisphaerae bacterium]|nr:hypothetical protein [Phycisphaerae bacterium]
MLARPSHAFVILTLLAGVAAAQQAPYLPANTPDANRLLADRVKFVKENYALDQSAMNKLTKDLMGLVPFHEKYMKDAGKTVYRMELAMSIVTSDSQIPDAEKPARLEHFRSQMTDLYSKAPLSLRSVIKMADAQTTPDKAQLAHAKIGARLAGLLKGQPFEIDRVDGLLIPPSKGSVPLPVITAGTPPAPPPQPAANANPPTAAANPAVASNPPPSNPNPFLPPTPQHNPPPQPALPAPPPRVVGPAPALDQWKTNVDAAIAKYEFNPDQKKIAERALDQCKLRAETAKSKVKGELEAAAKISDEKARATKITEINKPVDTAYDELMQRVESLATAEQKAKVDKKQK